MTAERPAHNRLDLDTTEVIAAYEAGESEQSIAIRLGVSRTPIRQRLVEAGVSIRGTSAAQLVKNSRLSAEARRAQTEAANEASRGRKASPEERIKRAKTCEREQTHTTETERYFARMLADRGVDDLVLGKAVGPFNLDIAASPVAVEIFGGHWHGHGRHAARAPERFRYLFYADWVPLIIWVHHSRAPLTPEAADYAASFIKEARSHPTLRRQYRVIWGTGEDVTWAVPNVDQLAVKPPLRRG